MFSPYRKHSEPPHVSLHRPKHPTKVHVLSKEELGYIFEGITKKELFVSILEGHWCY